MGFLNSREFIDLSLVQSFEIARIILKVATFDLMTVSI